MPDDPTIETICQHAQAEARKLAAGSAIPTPDESTVATLRKLADTVQIRGARVEDLLSGDELVPIDETRAVQEPELCADLQETLRQAMSWLNDAEETARKLRRVIVTPLSREELARKVDELRAAGKWGEASTAVPAGGAGLPHQPVG
jgi:hypothetical protein